MSVAKKRGKKAEAAAEETPAEAPAKKTKKAAPAKKKAPPKAPPKKKVKKAEADEIVAADSLEPFHAPPDPEQPPIDAGRDPLDDDDEDELAERVHHTAEALDEAATPDEAPEVALSPEEQELSAIYGDEMGGGAIASTEFRDHRTSDEDRPMTPEINAREERNKRWEERRRQRRERRDQRAAQREERQQRREDNRGPQPQHRQEHRPDRADRPDRGDRPQLPAPAQLSLPAAPPSNGHGEHVVHRVGNSLGDAAWQVFQSLRSSQPLPVKQLAAMMRKRGLLDVDPEQAWPHLKAALIGDERSYRQLGLRPRIVYRGRDLFGPGPVAIASTSAAEASLASALSQLAVATHNALRDRVGRASPGGFERLVHAYLVSTGYQDNEWVKRVGGISYATALPPDGSSAIMVSARSGNEAVDRRGVGELRVGVEAKQLLAGLLLSARELSEDAERELVRPGRSIMVLCGDAFVGALIGAGVGVVTAAAPLRYVDDQLLDELLAG
jgi:hypothetical protein